MEKYLGKLGKVGAVTLKKTAQATLYCGLSTLYFVYRWIRGRMLLYLLHKSNAKGSEHPFTISHQAFPSSMSPTLIILEKVVNVYLLYVINSYKYSSRNPAYAHKSSRMRPNYSCLIKNPWPVLIYIYLIILSRLDVRQIRTKYM